MPLTRTQARDEIYALLKAAVEDTTADDRPTVKYDDTDGVVPRDEGARWLSAYISHNAGGQGSLTNAEGVKIWDRVGILTIEIHTPVATGLGLSDRLSSIIQGAYEGKSTPGGVWFRNVRATEKGSVGSWNRVDVSAEFEYCEIK